MLRRLAVLTAAAVVAVTGCTVGGDNAGRGGAQGDSVTLTFLTFETPNLDAKYWDAAIARASAKVPGVSIKKLVAPSADRTAYAKQLSASGQLPDVMIAVNPDGFAQSGQLAPWTVEELKNYEFPESNPIGGKVYQLPYNTQPTPLVYYNKSLFAKAGIPAPPKTYPDLLTVSAKLKAAGINPVVVGGGGKDTFAAGYPWIAAVGADLYRRHPDWLSKRAAGQLTFADPAFVAAADKVADLARRGYIDKAGLSRSYADTEQAFRDGKGAMYPMGSWFAASADQKKPGFEVGVFPWPTAGGEGVVPAYTGGGMSVSTEAPDVDKAKKWALAFMEDKENLDAGVKADGSIIAIKGYQPPTDMGPVYQQTVAVYERAVRSGGVVNAFTVETGDGALPPGMPDQVFAAAADLISGRKSATDVAKFLDTQYVKATR
ncbi:multiple sugar transport system substrate-binding protein [Kribbella steppae]|uniref:Multiple sugar transport system substrate-binding protein n=1 Tax=Kribbella steppae TaxID=2512223 RepID=A0A4R2HE32_9ACTN|nr:extracellular solute-binding protein [Kribbella steppae]TCO26602.1 multiple sugar transport system substrate-binding protein [Kribbella steppae]